MTLPSLPGKPHVASSTTPNLPSGHLPCSVTAAATAARRAIPSKTLPSMPFPRGATTVAPHPHSPGDPDCSGRRAPRGLTATNHTSWTTPCSQPNELRLSGARPPSAK